MKLYLARPAADITLLHIVTAVDGPPPEQDLCVIGLDICSDTVACPLHDRWKQVRADIRDALDHQTLANLATGLRHKRAQLAKMSANPTMESALPQD